MSKANPQLVGNSPPSGVRVVARVPDGYRRVRWNTLQKLIWGGLRPSECVATYVASDRGGPGRLAKRWYQWWVPAERTNPCGTKRNFGTGGLGQGGFFGSDTVAALRGSTRGSTLGSSGYRVGGSSAEEAYFAREQEKALGRLRAAARRNPASAHGAFYAQLNAEVERQRRMHLAAGHSPDSFRFVPTAQVAAAAAKLKKKNPTDWWSAGNAWLQKAAEREAATQLRAHIKAGRARSTFRYSPPDWHRDAVAALGQNDEERFKAIKMWGGHQHNPKRARKKKNPTIRWSKPSPNIWRYNDGAGREYTISRFVKGNRARFYVYVTTFTGAGLPYQHDLGERWDLKAAKALALGGA